MYRAAAVIILCLAVVTVIGSFTRTDTTKFTREISDLREEIRSLQELSHEFTSLEQEVQDIQKKLTTVRIEQNPAVVKSNYTITNNFKDDPFLGNPESPILVMMFGDYECKSCQSFWRNSLPEIKSKWIDSNRAFFVFRDFALTSHKYSKPAGNFAHCAGEQGAYWEAFNLLYEKMDTVSAGDFETLGSQLPDISVAKLQRCTNSGRYDKEMLADRIEGAELGAKGIPGFFIGKRTNNNQFEGVFIRGAQPTSIIAQEIEKQLA